MTHDLERFLTAQAEDFDTALAEIKSGKKKSHWMWYIFPQFCGLGQSHTSRFYAINSKEEAEAYLHHPVLGTRLKEISEAVLELNNPDARMVFGRPDDRKLKSCMTLFSEVAEHEDTVFNKVLEVYFDGERDSKTLQLIKWNWNLNSWCFSYTKKKT